MDKTISAADANRQFSLLLRGVREGHSYGITSHGKLVARLAPATERDPVMDSARTALVARLARQPDVCAERWTRDELYENDR